MKRHRTETDNHGKESGDGQAPRRNRSTLPIYTIVPSPDTGRLVVTLRRQGANGSSRMASPDSTVDTMGDVTNISHSRKERGGLAGRHHRLRNDGCPYVRQSEQSGRVNAEEELKVSLFEGESSSPVVVKGQRLPHKVAMKKLFGWSAGLERGSFDEPKSTVQDAVAEVDGECERHGDLAKREDETTDSDLNDIQEGSSILEETAELKSDGVVSISSTSVEYDATIDDDDDE